uniref:hypothetical protein n=1 Tax=Pseudonocardia sp. CA-138482 TaxID=3240023 RepID=UPI003F492C1D
MRGAAKAERRIDWTPDAKVLRLALTTYLAGLRTLEERAEEVREAARRVPAEDLAVIIGKVTEASGGDPDELRKVVSGRA